MEGAVAILKLPAFALMSGRFPLPRKGFGALFGVLGACDDVISQTRFFPLTAIVAYLAAARGRRIAIVDHGSGHFRYASPLLDALSIAYEHAITIALALVRPREMAAALRDHVGVGASQRHRDARDRASVTLGR
jgi:hypothetical protein